MDISRRRFFGGRKSGAPPFRPPWSLPEALFVDRCTHCDDCIKACPTGLLVRGDAGLPIADFSHGQCSFCGDCAKVCLTGAIAHDLTQAPWFFGIEIGEGCLAAQNVECRICGEICDVSAIRFKPRIGGVPLPEVDNGSCNGCGACMAPCPVVAIKRVTTHPVMELL
jgi:ferredoxin-type protein NapF